MRHDIKTELTQSMDSLRFSAKAREDMTNMLINEMKNQKQTRRHNARKLLLLSLAAAILLVTLTGAAVFTHWSRTAQHRYDPSQQVKEQAERSGLSVMLEDTPKAPESGDIISATDQGITVTAVQTIIDNYEARLIFRIDGFQFPEDRYPAVCGWKIAIDGKQDFYTIMYGSLFDGTVINGEGKRVYASTGKPVQLDDDGCVILEPRASDGSLEYTISIAFRDNIGEISGKEIDVQLLGFGVESTQKAADPEALVSGSWNLHWTLRNSGESMTITPNAEIGDSGVTLLEAQIGPMTLIATYQLSEYWDGWKTLETFPQAVYAVRMKDGGTYYCVSNSGHYLDEDKLILQVEARMFNTLLDLNEVDKLLFFKGWDYDVNGNPTTETYYEIPIA